MPEHIAQGKAIIALFLSIYWELPRTCRNIMWRPYGLPLHRRNPYISALYTICAAQFCAVPPHCAGGRPRRPTSHCCMMTVAEGATRESVGRLLCVHLPRRLPHRRTRRGSMTWAKMAQGQQRPDLTPLRFRKDVAPAAAAEHFSRTIHRCAGCSAARL